MRALGSRVPVVEDPHPFATTNPWRCAREAWRRTPRKADWRLVLQDDVLPCRDFLAGARRALSVAPAPIVAFYLGWVPQQTATLAQVRAGQCSSWVTGVTGEWVPTVATAIRADLARDLAAFHPGDRQIGDDTILGQFVGARGLNWCATIPSLCQHDDDEPSTVGGHRAHPGPRQASCFIGSYSALEVDWTRQ